MFHIREFDRLRQENNWYSLTAIEILKEKFKNPLEDIRKGKISKEKVSQILNMAFNHRLVSNSYRETFQKKLLEIA